MYLHSSAAADVIQHPYILQGAEEKMDVEASMNLIKAIPYCSNRQLRAMTAAKADLAKMFRSKGVDISIAQDLKVG